MKLHTDETITVLTPHFDGPFKYVACLHFKHCICYILGYFQNASSDMLRLFRMQQLHFPTIFTGGGGVLILNAVELCKVNGLLSANGQAGSSRGGGGAGGSIHITTSEFDGTGDIEVIIIRYYF